MKNKYKRLLIIVFSLCSASIYSFFILDNFKENLEFFFTPSEVHKFKQLKKTRIGGVIIEKSLKYQNKTYEFLLGDGKSQLKIKFKGIVPNLFKEKQAVIVRGKMMGDFFMADELLTKHDEYYIPKEIMKQVN